MGIFNEFNKKEKPVFTGLRFGFGGGGGGTGGATPPPGAPFVAKLVMVGGGGSGGIAQGGGGGGGAAVLFIEQTILVNNAYPYVVGKGAAISPNPGRGLPGNNSSWNNDPDFQAGAGGGGGTGPGSQPGGVAGGTNHGSPGGGGYTSPSTVAALAPGVTRPYWSPGNLGGTGAAQPSGGGGNLGGGGGGHGGAGQNAVPGGSGGGGNGGDGKEVPNAYLPDTFTQNDTGPSPGQFLGMLTSNPAALRRTFGGGGGGGSEHGNVNQAVGGGGGGHGGWGSPNEKDAGPGGAPPAGPAGIVNPPSSTRVRYGEPGYHGRGGGGGGGGYTTGTSEAGTGGSGVIIMQVPINHVVTTTADGSEAPYVNTYTDPGDSTKKYIVITAVGGTTSDNSATITFS